MTYVLRFRPEVVGDLEDAAQWYDDRRQGLGGEFLDECKSVIWGGPQSLDKYRSGISYSVTLPIIPSAPLLVPRWRPQRKEGVARLELWPPTRRAGQRPPGGTQLHAAQASSYTSYGVR